MSSRLSALVRFRELTGALVPQLESLSVVVGSAAPASSVARKFVKRYVPALKYQNPEAKFVITAGDASTVTASFSAGRSLESWDPAKVRGLWNLNELGEREGERQKERGILKREGLNLFPWRGSEALNQELAAHQSVGPC